MAIPSNPEDSCTKAFYYFENIVEERSNGRIDVQVYDSGQLGSHADYIDSMQMHSLAAAEVNTSVLGNVDSAFSVFDLPYLTDGMDQLIEDLSTAVSAKSSTIASRMPAGLATRSAGSSGLPVTFTPTRDPLPALLTLPALRLRIMESALMSEAMTDLGMIPVPLAATERYMALQTGTVDAAENSVPLIITQAEYEVTKYVVLTEHFCTPNLIAMDVEFYNALPDDLKAIIDEAGNEAGKYASQLDKENEAVALEELANDYGMTICEIEDKTEFMDAVAPLYDSYRDKIGQEHLRLLRQIIYKVLEKQIGN